MGIFETNNMPEPVTSLTGSNVEAIAKVLAEAGLLD
jgi:hypothetical protein